MGTVKDQLLLGVCGDGDESGEHSRFLGLCHYSVRYDNGGYATLHIC